MVIACYIKRKAFGKNVIVFLESDIILEKDDIAPVYGVIKHVKCVIVLGYCVIEHVACVIAFGYSVIGMVNRVIKPVWYVINAKNGVIVTEISVITNADMRHCISRVRH